MKREPPFGPAFKSVLRVLAPLYSAFVRARAWCYRQRIFRSRRLPGTVISIGNLTVGGTGKTPMVLWLAERLSESGKRPAILTRGYRGAKATGRGGGFKVENDSAEPQSDEVALLRNRLQGKVQFGVGPNRFHNGQALARQGVDCFILDDGFQHLKLKRDVDIVLIDATDPFGGGQTLPAGRLREPISALRRSDIVVITRSNNGAPPALEAMVRRHTTSPLFFAETKLESILRLPDAKGELSRKALNDKRFLAFCGIGHSSAFFNDLRRWGFQLAGEKSFADHHVYTAAEMDELVRAAQGVNADALVCTEKDIWNLRHVQTDALPVYFCRISLELPEEEFLDAVTQAIARNKMVRVR